MKTNSIGANFIKFAAVRNPAKGHCGAFHQTTKVISGDSDISEVLDAFREFLLSMGYQLQGMDVRLIDTIEEEIERGHLQELQEKLEAYENLDFLEEDEEDEDEPETMQEYWAKVKKKGECGGAHSCHSGHGCSSTPDIEEVF